MKNTEALKRISVTAISDLMLHLESWAGCWSFGVEKSIFGKVGHELAKKRFLGKNSISIKGRDVRFALLESLF